MTSKLENLMIMIVSMIWECAKNSWGWMQASKSSHATNKICSKRVVVKGL